MKNQNRYYAHQELIKRTKLKLGKTFLMAVRVFDRHVGMFYKKRTGGGVIDYSPISINRKGMADNWGVITCYCICDTTKARKIPIHWEMESKTGNAKLSKEQKDWRDFCDSMGIWWFENRNEDDLIKAIYDRAALEGMLIHGVNYGR